MGPTFTNVRVLEAQPLPWASAYLGGTAQAALVLWECDVNVAGQPPQPYRNLSLISTAPMNESQWMYYTSHTMSPAGRFTQNYQTLVAIWSSWKVSDALLQQRMRKAAETMREITRIQQESHANTTRAYDNVNKGWSHVIRGDWPVEDVRDGRRADIDNNVINRVVDHLNEVDGPNNWRIVPLQELNVG
jgi:hypothetical protein